MIKESATKILVIEDDARTRNIFVDCLAAEGYYAIGAENGIVGVQQAQAHLPDVVICDIAMPRLDGYGVLKALRSDPATAIISFIFLTASVTKTEIRRGMEMGADDYLTKPTTVEELLKAIAARLEKRATLRSWYDAKPASFSKTLATEPAKAVMAAKSIFPSVPELKEVFDYIEANYHQPITLCDVAQAVGYSPAYLTNRVGSQTGHTVNRWIVERRMVAARYLLQNSDRSVEQIATELGYQNTCHFSRQFRQHHGAPPQAWRKVHQGRALMSIA
ncbi:response regulator transcription factor [Aliterella atlantica]|uniref:Chemotaxis protein CheY n=1 Tax=Aliterella atlantica CENA595 TaxID=1618023 RepID=A0A0D8ZY83_9CYAN|nr:DNA-binding response regulator [Aliterella atlantica]KJH73362.1 chemotaxis protein CheY [Aliterella atlantica CENA595]